MCMCHRHRASWEGFDEVMKEVKFKSLKDPEGFTKGFWK